MSYLLSSSALKKIKDNDIYILNGCLDCIHFGQAQTNSKTFLLVYLLMKADELLAQGS